MRVMNQDVLDGKGELSFGDPAATLRLGARARAGAAERARRPEPPRPTAAATPASQATSRTVAGD
jgi:hypothetical protein